MAGSECRPLDLQDALIYLAGITDGLPVVIYYGRVSTDIQRDDGYSLEMQDSHHRRDAGDRYPDGCHAILISDDGLSGTLPYQRGRLKKGRYRPGLTLVKDLVDTGLVSALGVYKCNRLSRKSRIWLELLEDHLDPHGVLFFSSSECVDSSTDAGRMILSILMSEAEFAREQIASGMRDGLHLRRDEGYYLGGEPPYGWRCQDPRFIPDGERVNIEPHPEEAAVVRRVVNLVLGGTRFLTIAKLLTAEGLPTACGLDTWGHAAVRKMASCPTHAGLLRDGKGGLVEGRHFPLRIVDPETYYAVLREIERRREADREHDKRDDLLFDGLLTCAICGGKMCVSSPTNLPRLYCCRGRRLGHEHPHFSLRADQVELRLQDLLQRCIEDLRVANGTINALDAEIAQTKQEAHREKRRLQERLRQSESDICLWASRMDNPEYNHDVVQEELDWLASHREETLSELKRLDKETKREKKQANTYAAAADLVRSGGRLWESMTFSEKRELASALVQSLVCGPTEECAVINSDVVPIGRQALTFRTGHWIPEAYGVGMP